MTEAARWNLQHGIPEDKNYEWTNYTPTSALDRLILQRVKFREQYNQKQQEIKDQKDLEKQIEKSAHEAVEKALEDLLKVFNH